MAVAIFASAWGVKLTQDEPETVASEEVPQVLGPSIAELAAAAGAMVPGGDTLAASLAVKRKMEG